MAKRKTFQVNKLKEIVNRRNIHSTCDKNIREGWNCVLAEVLHQTGNYDGFRYLGIHETPRGHLPGVLHPKATINDAAIFPDDTRIQYN